jgi:general nucleoside transport system permease protein
MRRAAIAALTAILAVALLACAGALLGASPLTLLRVLVRGSAGSPYAIGDTLLQSIPLLLTGLSVALAFRAGVWNIGAEGQFIVGALAAFCVGRWMPAGLTGVASALIAAFLAGAFWGSLASLMKLWRGAPEVLTTILLNFIALHLLGWCVNGPLREVSAQYPQTDRLPDATALPLLGATRLHAGLLLALAICLAVYWLLYRTATGLRLRAAGHNAAASRWAGIDVPAETTRAMAISAGIAGVAGAIELLGVTHRLYEGFAVGYGYSGIAVALLAQLHPLATLASALFFAALSTGAGELQRAAGVSASIATLGQALVILALIFFMRKERP